MCLGGTMEHKMRTEQCFLDGVTNCTETKTCDQCEQDEVKWNESWSKWNDSQFKKHLDEVVAAKPPKSRIEL
jgi:hypothetical protein